ncbi:MAG: hypothetical protein ACU83N_11305, partial [Gammaproteobacteria bacterium]
VQQPELSHAIKHCFTEFLPLGLSTLARPHFRFSGVLFYLIAAFGLQDSSKGAKAENKSLVKTDLSIVI